MSEKSRSCLWLQREGVRCRFWQVTPSNTSKLHLPPWNVSARAFRHFNVKSSIFMRSNFRGWNMNFCQIMICWYVNSLAYFMPKNSRKLNHHENKWFHIINISPRFVNDFCIMCKNNLKQIIYLGIYNLAILHFSPLVNNVWTFLFLFIYFFFFSVFSSSFFLTKSSKSKCGVKRSAPARLSSALVSRHSPLWMK